MIVHATGDTSDTTSSHSTSDDSCDALLCADCTAIIGEEENLRYPHTPSRLRFISHHKRGGVQ